VVNLTDESKSFSWLVVTKNNRILAVTGNEKSFHDEKDVQPLTL